MTSAARLASFSLGVVCAAGAFGASGCGALIGIGDPYVAGDSGASDDGTIETGSSSGAYEASGPETSGDDGASRDGALASDAFMASETSSSGGDSATHDGPTGLDASGLDGSGIHDAVAEGPVCDKDGDGYLGGSDPCDGTDCCDTDARANPGDTAYYTTPDNCGGFDYDCDGKESPEYAVNLVCSGTGAMGCTGSGFIGNPPCGVSGPYAAGCVETSGGCAPGPTTMMTQACR
jgi:hypothetical protein